MADISKEILDIFTRKIPQIYPNSTIRQHQVQMALDVADFLFNKSERVMFVEAPVGTGKSLGLLIPSSIYSREQSKNIIYATSTISLQNQIFDDDSVILSKIGLLKNHEKILAQGKRNYLCESLVDLNISSFSEDELAVFNDFFESCKYGLISEFIDKFPNFDRNKMNYLLMDKYKGGDCFCKGHLHRREYSRIKYKLKITNHAQLIQSYNNIKERRAPIVDFDNTLLIVDEAHAMKENFLNNLEKSLELRGFPKINDEFVGDDREQYLMILQNLATLQERYASSTTASSMRYGIKTKELQVFELLRKVLNNMIIRIDSLLNSRKSRKLEKIASHLEEMSTALSYLTRKDCKSWLTFGNNSIILHSVTKSFNQSFNDMIKRFPRNTKVIFMSGTLTTTDSVSSEILTNWDLLPKSYDYKNYPSVFDLENQAIVYIPEHMPHSNSEYHLDYIQDKLPELIDFDEGGALILCTSNSYVSEISTFLKHNKEVMNTILTQEGPNIRYISKKFKQDVNSILVGSGSFFTGFSVEGEALNKLFLTKLPYPVPDDPYIDLISDGYDWEEKKKKIILPTMKIRLEQGLGRLIRSQTDYGIITIFDNRIKADHPSYSFIQSLGYRITTNWDDVISFKKSSKAKINSANQNIFDSNLLTLPKISTFVKQKTNLSSKAKKPFVSVWTNTETPIQDIRDWFRKFVKDHKEDSHYKVRASYNQKNARDVYQAAINFCYAKDISTTLVMESFPFQNDLQKEKFSSISPTVSGPVR
ncbi:ATP-dependent DNA helicase [Lactococcus garvieae]|nr:ATP-dependent DNA helicase [Lactococcus garvieae]CEF50988.1 putative ATP-dependent helicase DinG [Lactococcus garvieae]